MKKIIAVLLVALTLFTANILSKALAESPEKAVLELASDKVSLDRDSVQNAAIYLSVEDELYVAVALSPSTVDRLNELISESEDSRLALSVGERTLLGPLPIHVDQMPSELRVSADNIDDAYLLLRALNRKPM